MAGTRNPLLVVGDEPPVSGGGAVGRVIHVRGVGVVDDLGR